MSKKSHNHRESAVRAVVSLPALFKTWPALAFVAILMGFSTNLQATCTTTSGGEIEFVWIGASGGSWSDISNWTENGGTATQYPNASNHNVVIGTGDHVVLDVNASIKHFCIDNGTLEFMASLSIIGNSWFNGSQMTNPTSGSFTLTMVNTTMKSDMVGSEFEITVDINGAEIVFQDCTFEEAVDAVLVGTASTNSVSPGGNIFNAAFSATNQSSYAFQMSMSTTKVDVFNASASFHIPISAGSAASFSVADAGSGNKFTTSTTFHADQGTIWVASNAQNTVFDETNGAGEVLFQADGDANNLEEAQGKIYVSNNGTNTSFDIDLRFKGTGYGEIKFCQSTGNAELEAGHTMLSSDEVKNFVTVALRNFTQQGSTAQAMDFEPYSATVHDATLLLQSGCVFNAVVTFEAPNIGLDGAHYKNDANFERTGGNVYYAYGGNIFDGNTYILLSGDGNWHLSYYDNAGDKFYGHLTVEETGSSGNLYPAAKKTNDFTDDVTVKQGSILFGANGGICHFTGGFTQYIHCDGCVNNQIRVKRSRINKGVNDVVLKTNFRVTNNGTIQFVDGRIVPDNGELVIFNDNTDLDLNYMPSNASFINGAVQKIGDDDFIFPVGKGSFFMPIGIDAPLNTLAEYTAEYFHSPLPSESCANITAPLTQIDDCEYWKLETNASTISEPHSEVRICWTQNSCNIPLDFSSIRVAGMDCLGNCNSCSTPEWVNHGQSQYQLGTNGYHYITSASSTAYPIIGDEHYFTIGSRQPQEEEIISGYSYNNFGSYTRVEETAHLRVHGSVYNAQSGHATPEYGWFHNEGTVSLTRDWKNVSKNKAYLDEVTEAGNTYDVDGLTVFFGEYQRVLGEDQDLDRTQFHDVYMKGNGKKELFIDAWADGVTTIDSTELATRSNIYYTNTHDPNTMVVIDGFVSTDNPTGALRRQIAPDPVGSSSITPFPMGSSQSPARYRPVDVSGIQPCAGSPCAHINVIDIQFRNYNADFDSYLRQKKQPHINEVNEYFFHEVDWVTTGPNACAVNGALCDIGNTPSTSDYNFDLEFHFYDLIDAPNMNHLAHWDDDADPNDFWNSTATYSSCPGFGYQNSGFSCSTNIALLQDLTNLINSTGSQDFWKTVDPMTLNLQNSATTFSSVKVSDYKDFSHKPFALCESGIIINTENFGNGVSWTASNGSGGTYGTGGTGGQNEVPNGGSVVITINGNNTNSGSVIEIPVNGGNAGDPIITLGSGGNSITGGLDPALYITSGTTIAFLSTPADTGLPVCVNDLTVNANNQNTLVVDKSSSETFHVGGLSNGDVHLLIEKNNLAVYQQGNIPSGTYSPYSGPINMNSDPDGVYKYKLYQPVGAGHQLIAQGQFILQP